MVYNHLRFPRVFLRMCMTHSTPRTTLSTLTTVNRLIRTPCCGLWMKRATLKQGLISYVRFYSDDRNYRRSNPVPEDDNDPNQRETWSWTQLLPGILVGVVYFLASTPTVIPQVPFSFFLQQMVNTGEVSKLEVSSSQDRVYIYLYPGAIVNGQEVRARGPQFMMSISGVDSFESKLCNIQDQLGIPSHSRISVTYRKQSEAVSVLTSGVITLAIFGGLWYLMSRVMGVKVSFSLKGDNFNPFGSMIRAKTTVVNDSSQILTRFSDVAGMKEAKQEVMEFVDYLKDPNRFTSLGARIPKGALLHGPPGTGKTLLARAIAGESQVPFLSIAGPDFVEVFAGVGSARVRDLFKQARTHAPCILYIDEIDAVGRSRKSGSSIEGHSEQENTLNQILVELDGINPLESVVVLASTNRVDILDQALLRPGRFDRAIAIDLPTLSERKEIFEIYLKKLVLEKACETYSSRLASLTPGHSGASIANIVNEAALHAARELGTEVSEKDFEYAIERVIAGTEKKGGVLTSEERRVIAYHEAGHALVGWLLEHTDPVLKVSIVPRTKGILGYAQHLPLDQKLKTTEQIFDLMCMTLGGRVAEAVTFKKITTGAQDDLKKVTDLAYKQVAEFGMSSIGNISIPIIKSNEPMKRFYSDKLAFLIDKEARNIVTQAYHKTEKILRENYHKLQELAESLLVNEVLNYKDIVNILGPLPHHKIIRTHTELEDMW